jgi:ribulose-phosphate 3-epimerase
MRTGVALNPATSVAVIHDVLNLTDLVLVMTVNPGFYGQPFLKTMMPKVRAARELLDASGSPARLQVDGGLTAQTAPLALQAGADTFVAASAIFNYPDGIEAGVASLRASITP